MNLAVEISDALRRLGTTRFMTDQSFTKLMDACILVILKNEDGEKRLSSPEFQNLNLDVLKAAYFSLLTFLVEASRRNIRGNLLSAILIQDHNFAHNRANYLVSCYEHYLSRFRAALSHIGDHHPHIVNASWVLDYCIKDSSLDHVAVLQYLIQLHTEDCDETVELKKNVKKIKFVCTLEELQDLVGKLKDAVKHIERLAAI